jgi:hypothetical protein
VSRLQHRRGSSQPPQRASADDCPPRSSRSPPTRADPPTIRVNDSSRGEVHPRRAPGRHRGLRLLAVQQGREAQARLPRLRPGRRRCRRSPHDSRAQGWRPRSSGARPGVPGTTSLSAAMRRTRASSSRSLPPDGSVTAFFFAYSLQRTRQPVHFARFARTSGSAAWRLIAGDEGEIVRDRRRGPAGRSPPVGRRAQLAVPGGHRAIDSDYRSRGEDGRQTSQAGRPDSEPGCEQHPGVRFTNADDADAHTLPSPHTDAHEQAASRHRRSTGRAVLRAA